MPIAGARFAAVVSVLLAGCAVDREPPAETPVFEEDVESILSARCESCHAGDAPARGYRVGAYLDVIACVGSPPRSAVEPSNGRAPILTALGTEVHRSVVSDAEADALARWVRAGSPAFRGTVHSPGILNPRSPEWHGRVLSHAGWSPILDAEDPSACGRCHEGAPVRPEGVRFSAPGATPCTSCHTAPEGVFACPTCHGAGSRSYPPRDPCFFPADAARAGAHAAHVDPSQANLPCSACHPAPGKPTISGLHADGAVEVVFDSTVVRGEASFDGRSGACAVSCHDRGGARSQPAWTETSPMGCGDCHASPPANHFSGPCSTCHGDANADGTALTDTSLHLNGRVDVGDGSGQCGACHGDGADPWPKTGAHTAHRSPILSTPVECNDCHVVPASLHAAGHLNGTVEVVLSGRATARGARPVWDGATCTEVACHGAGLVDPPALVPRWTDTSGAAKTCTACHGAPPTQHTASTSCDRSTCHGSEVSRDAQGRLGITGSGRATHIDGLVQPEIAIDQNP